MRHLLPLPFFWLFLGGAAAQQPALLAAANNQTGTMSGGSTPSTTSPIPVAPAAAVPAAAPAAPSSDTVYNIAEEMPSFPGGQAAFGQFLRRSLQYPEAALNAHISGKVHVRFTVSEDGHLLDPEVVKGLGYGLDQEALRLVRLMPFWTPGKVGGRAVRVRYVVPIVFRALE